MTFRLLVVLLAVAALAACGPVPRAFKPGKEAEGVRNAIVDGTFTKGIEVDPVDNTPVLMSKLLARTTVDSFEPFGIPAGVAPFKAAEYVLHGRADLDPNAHAIPYVTLHWKLSNRKGTVLAELEQPVDATSGEWNFGEPDVIVRVAEDVAHRVAAVLGSIVPAQGPAPPPGRGVFVAPVDGAPGDGDFSLTKAIAEAMKKRGSYLTRFREQAKYVLNGKMEISQPVKGRQGVRVTWRVTLADGTEVGKATQENTVPAGTFDSQWGPTAKLIAEAAVDGINGVMDGWEKKENVRLAGHSPLGMPSDLADGALPPPEQNRVLGRMEDHVVPATAPASAVVPPKSDAAVQDSQLSDSAAPKQTRSPPDIAAVRKTVLGIGDVGGEEQELEVFHPPTLPAMKEGDPNAFLVAEVSGAPGDGNDLLAQALKRVLLARDQSVTDDPRQARFVVRGLVIMSEPKDGKQTARIVWSVDETGGKTLGSAEQRKRVPAGSLDKSWGDTALDVAMGAIIGIQKVLGGRVRPFARAVPGDNVPAHDVPTRSPPADAAKSSAPPAR